MSAPADLVPPDKVVRDLAEDLDVAGRPRETVYLSSGSPHDRWAKVSFRDVDEEFNFNATWVAKRLRESFGPPDHMAYMTVATAGLVGLRSAAWRLGAAVVYVSLRDHHRKLRRVLRVVLGAIRPVPPSAGGLEGQDTHDAVWLPREQLVH